MNRSNSTIYVRNLSYNRDRNGLRSIFSKYGSIKDIKIIVEPSTNQSRGMAFIEYNSPVEAALAIKSVNETELDGRLVRVTYATPLQKRHTPKIVKTTKEKALAGERSKLKNPNKDLDYTSIQLAKKARNEARRKSNPLYNK